jgi:hypothetical protein
MKKILWVKFGWSEYYRGGPVDGNFSWLKAKGGKRNGGRGHEAFNFMPAHDGTYYCYVPPQLELYAPWNNDNKGWTVVCLAKNPKHTGIHVVGWYEDATLLGEWKKPPSNHPGAKLGSSGSAYDWSYCIKSKSAFFIPPERRSFPFSDVSVRQAKYSFLAGPDVGRDAAKDRVLRLIETRLAKLRVKAVHNPTEARAPDPELDPVDPLKVFGAPEHRKDVEKAAEKAVIAYYRARGFAFEDRTKLNCGYDFLFSKRSKSLHVEVKGTSSKNAGFFITRNEYDAGYQKNPAWRLAMVTHALSKAPSVEIFNAKKLRKSFDLTPYVYLGRPVAKVGGT